MVCSSARRYRPPRKASAKLVPSAEMPKPENIRRIVTGPKSENRSIRKSRSINNLVPRTQGSAKRCAAEPGPILAYVLLLGGPGSAQQRNTLQRVRDTKLDLRRR